MKPFLNIRTVPIEVEYKVTRAALRQNDTPPPTADVSRSKGKQNIQRTPAKLNMDTTEVRASRGMKSASRSISEHAETGRSDAHVATQQYAEAANAILDSHGRGSPIVDVVLSKLNQTRESVLTFVPSVAPQIEYIPGNLNFDFSMDQLQYNWNVNPRAELEYVPHSIEFSVVQYPQVIIEYMGGPIYVPKSSDPNYVPPMDYIA